MAKVKTNLLTQLRELDDQALVKKIAELRKELVEHHRANAAGEIASTAVINKTRKAIAKALTVLAEKKRQAVEAPAQKEEK